MTDKNNARKTAKTKETQKTKSNDSEHRVDVDGQNTGVGKASYYYQFLSYQLIFPALGIPKLGQFPT